MRNVRVHLSQVGQLLADALPDERVYFGEEAQRAANDPAFEPTLELGDWLGEIPKGCHPEVRCALTREELAEIPAESLVDRVRNAFVALFPLVLLAQSDDPLGDIGRYLGDMEDDEESGVSEPYSLQQCAEDLSMPLERLQQWVAAIHRKGQAVLYGPPGTGKTFVARHIGRHLTGGSDGFMELVQFHPALRLRGLHAGDPSSDDLHRRGRIPHGEGALCRLLRTSSWARRQLRAGHR